MTKTTGIDQLIKALSTKDKDDVYFGTILVDHNSVLKPVEGYVIQREGSMGELYLTVTNKNGYVSDSEYNFIEYKHKEIRKLSDVRDEINLDKTLLNVITVHYIGYKNSKDLILKEGGIAHTLSGKTVGYLHKAGYKRLEVSPYIVSPSLQNLVQKLQSLDDLKNHKDLTELCATELGVVTRDKYMQLLKDYNCEEESKKIVTIPFCTKNWYDKNRAEFEKSVHTDYTKFLHFYIREELEKLPKELNKPTVDAIVARRLLTKLQDVKNDKHIQVVFDIHNLVNMSEKEIVEYLNYFDVLVHNLKEKAEKYKYKLR